MSYKYVNGEPIADKLTDEQIAAAIDEVGASYGSLWFNGVKNAVLHDDHKNDFNAVRLCVAWLEAQPRTATSKVCSDTIRICVEAWSGVRVHCSAVWAAALMLGFKDPLHPTISKRFTLPHFSRIAGNPLAFFSNGKEYVGDMPDTRWMSHHGYGKDPDIVGDLWTTADRIRNHGYAVKHILDIRNYEKEMQDENRTI